MKNKIAILEITINLHIFVLRKFAQSYESIPPKPSHINIYPEEKRKMTDIEIAFKTNKPISKLWIWRRPDNFIR